MSRPSNKVVKVSEPFIECYRCEQKYLTDIKRIHQPDGMQYINFVATKQFIRVAIDGIYVGHLMCVDYKECRYRQIMLSLSRI